MKFNLTKITVFVFLLLAINACRVGMLPSHPDEIHSSSINYSPPTPQKFVSSDGVTLYYMYNNELPLVDISMYIRGGSYCDNSEEIGLSPIMGSMLRDGGYEGVTPESLDQRLDYLGANISSSFSEEYGEISFNSHSENVSEVFNVFSKIIKEPTFDQSRLELLKYRSSQSIIRRKEDPSTISSLTMKKLLHGSESPKGHVSSIDSIQKIRRIDLFKKYRELFSSKSRIITATGNITIDKVFELFEDKFGYKGFKEKEYASFQSLDQPECLVNAISKFPNLREGLRSSAYKPGVYFVQAPFEQSSIIISQLANDRNDPSIYPFSVFNKIFGFGSLDNILFNKIRSDLGLAYSVWGGFLPDIGSGTFKVSMATKSSDAINSVKEVFKILKEIRKQGVSENSTEKAKSSINNSFVFKFKTKADLVNRAAILDLYNYPKDYDERYLSRINKISPESILEEYRYWLREEDLFIVIVGDVPKEDLINSFSRTMPIFNVVFDTEAIVKEQIK